MQQIMQRFGEKCYGLAKICWIVRFGKNVTGQQFLAKLKQ
jgi:hypothetical protein